VSARRLVPSVLLLLAVAGVAGTQPRLARIAHQVKERDDVYGFPPPAQLHAATLGWDAAAMDLLWTKLLVEYGIHWSEHRNFLAAPMYIDAILELEPTYAPMYRIVGTILAYRPLQGTQDDVRLARSYLERGTVLRPNDSRLWMEYGQFMAYIAPSFLRDATEAPEWRKAGARAMGRAVELGADAEGVLTAAYLLSHAGATREAIPYLERAYAFTEKPEMAEIHEAIGHKLAELELSAMKDAADAAERAIDLRWQAEIPFVARDWYAVIGPVMAPARCAGLAFGGGTDCARDWTTVTATGGVSQGVGLDEP
jgi:tetratricopeptide (TPR) repeat protein